MDCQIPSIATLFSLVLFASIMMRMWMKSKTKSTTLNPPPGPWKLPLIGNMIDLAGELPHHRLRDLAKKYGPIMHLQLGEITSIVISSAEAAKEVMKTHDVIFAQRPQLFSVSFVTYNFTDVVFAPYGDYWRQLRKLCTLELLSAKRVQSFRSIREEEVSKAIRSISSGSGSVINLCSVIYSITYCITSRAAFGKIWKGQELFITLVAKIAELGGGFDLADVYPSFKLLRFITGSKAKLERLRRDLDNMLDSIIEDHRASKVIAKTGAAGEEEDLVDVLLNLQEGGNNEFHLTDDNLKAVIMDMLVAGIDTSATTLQWAMSEMLRQPRVMRKAQAEVRQVVDQKGNVDEVGLEQLNYLKLVIKETLRLHPPFPLVIPRECRESCKINGYDIPEKSLVLVNAWAIGRDPNYWTDPDKFFPERFLHSSLDYKGTNFEFIPFGAGRRMCPGMGFGIATVELVFALLLYHFDWKLPGGMKPEDFDMEESFGPVVKRKNDIHLIPILYGPLPVE